ncbi:hypothetical protein Tco_0628198 [Tanacetum coccineum]|uniref:DUF4283 domain-containing protein n=1 Tax=Tanacetum coccineum TaxID=301880 RepID=A0ABQ4WPK0_9ASTR
MLIASLRLSVTMKMHPQDPKTWFHNKEYSVDCFDTKVGQLGETSANCDLNEAYDKEDDLVNISIKNDNKQNDSTSKVDHSYSDRNENSEGSMKIYASAAKNSGCIPALNYHLRRMWSRFGFKEIVDNGNGNWLFKFSNELGMAVVANQSPWMVNSKPFMTTKGISAIRSSVGRPLIMDSITAYVCKNSVGRTKYARTDEEIVAERDKVDKNLGSYREDGFMQSKVRKPVLNINVSKQWPVNSVKNHYKTFEGPKSFTRHNRQQRNKKTISTEGNNASRNKEKNVVDEIPVHNDKFQKTQSNNKEP